MSRPDAYVCRIGYKDNPQGPGDYVELSSDDPKGMVYLGEPPFTWEDEPETIAFTKKGARQGNHATSILANNAKLTITVDLWASDPIALQAKIDKINTFLTQAKYRPVMVSLRLPNVGRMVLADVVQGQHIGPLNAQLSDATWLGNISRSLSIQLLCLPTTRDTRVTIRNDLPNPDFANTVSIDGNPAGQNYWTLDSGWATDSTDGYYGPTCMKFTGPASSSAIRSLTSSSVAPATGTATWAQAWLSASQANAYPVNVVLQKYNGTDWTTLTPLTIASFAAGQVPLVWKPFAQPYTVAAGVSGLRLAVQCDAREATSFKLFVDGTAIWINATTLPDEYMAVPGNLYNPARIYGLQGTELALSTLTMTPTTSAGATDQVGLIVAAINPREAGGIYGVRGGMPAITDAPLPFCLAGRTITAGIASILNLTINASIDLHGQDYIFWARAYYHSPSFPSSTCAVYLKALVGATGAATAFTATQDTPVTLANATTAALIKFGTLALVPPESALATPDLTDELPVVPIALVTVGTRTGSTGSSDTLTIAELYCVRGDWGYGWVQITGDPFYPAATASPSSFVLDSSSGTMRVRGKIPPTPGATPLPVNINPLVAMTPLRFNPAPGLVNEVQLFYERQSQTDVPATDGYLLEISYTPQRRAGT